MYRIYPLFVPFLFSSCTGGASVGFGGLIAMCIAITLIFTAIFVMINKKRKQSKLSLVSFSKDVQNVLDRLKEPKDKLTALNQLIDRIEHDKKYDKNPEWKSSVLAKVYEHMAAVYYSMSDEQGVIQACTHIIELDPSNGMAYYNRGSIYSNLGEYEKALSDFTEAAFFLPEYSNLYNNRGLVYDKLNRPQEALADFNYAIELEPSAITYYNRGNLYYEQGTYISAREDYYHYLELDPEDTNELREDVKTAIEVIDKKLSGIE